ncbi:MAG: NAD(P)H-hydrate dehydratase [Chloroflexi bacterium]|nr:NAD(P)H-hydrate dehydratase [Chloroflexota bacterium]MBU1661412.1 NAD(P)H-hydrate dehydratase [Chloroflexota bacterium]
MKITTVSQMRSLDNRAIEEFGIKAELLMENAGNAACFVLQNEFGIRGKSFLVFCGVGNNGGDGCVLARKIHSSGGDVKLFVLSDPGKFKGAAKLNFDIISRLPISVQRLTSTEILDAELAHCDLIADAIFGTGLSRDIGGLYRDVIERINASAKPVLSIDIPSGVHGDTGQVMGVAVKADYTVTFGLPKIGNLLYPGYDLGGELYVSHISFPPSMCTAASLKVAVNLPLELPPRQVAGHKGSFGEVLFIAGASSYYGAPYFAALSFLKAGGGYSRLAAPTAMTPFIANKGSEIVFVPQRETASGSIAIANKQALLKLSERMDMVVLGPGLSLDAETQDLVCELARDIARPLLIDGDGITALCSDLQIIRARKAETILTPHLGEMSRITGMPVSEIDSQKIPVLQRTAEELNATIVLKGAHSLIGYPDQMVFINMSGNSGMATAGAGDVLTGTIAAMFGLGLPLREAVRQGVFVHGLAGDLAAAECGEDGITAQDILDYLPPAVKAGREDVNALSEKYAGAHVI